MSRREQQKAGQIPLHTLLANVDYGFTHAFTTYGALGVKVWIYKGKALSKKEQRDGADAQTQQVPQEPPR